MTNEENHAIYVLGDELRKLENSIGIATRERDRIMANIQHDAIKIDAVKNAIAKLKELADAK